MKRCCYARLTSWLMLAAILLTAGAFHPSRAQAQDVTPPAVVGLDFNPKVIDVTTADQTVAITLHLTDDLSGVLEGFLYFVSPSGLQRQVDVFDPSNRMSGTDQDGVYTTTIKFPAFSETGQWQIQSLYLQDKAGNYTTLTGSQLAALKFPTSLLVTVTPAQPQIVSFDFTPHTVDVTTGDQIVTVTLHVKEPVNGIDYSLVRFDAPACGGPEAKGILLDQSTRISGDAYDGTYQGQVVIPAADTPGQWATTLYVQDLDGHYTVQLDPSHLQALRFPGYLTVVSGTYASDAIAGTVYRYAEVSTPVAGVTVTLTNSGGTPVASTPTDAGGHYLFSGLVPGTYTVTEMVPAGFIAVAANPGPGSGGTAVGLSQISVLVTGCSTTFKPNDFVIDYYNTSGRFTTYTQGGWGSTPHGGNPGALLANNFKILYPQGVRIGSQYTVLLRSAPAVQAFLPQGSAARPLTQNYVDPTLTQLKDVLAGQVLALQLSVDFSQAGITRSGLAALPGGASGHLSGLTIGQILAQGNQALGGSPTSASLDELNSAIDAILNRYDGGK